MGATRLAAKRMLVRGGVLIYGVSRPCLRRWSPSA